MPRPAPNHDDWIKAMASHVLAHGLAQASLRPLAAAAATSDRMLIYHFGSKDGVIHAVLERLAADLADHLDVALPPMRFETEAALIAAVLPLLRQAPLNSYQQVWFEILAAAAKGDAAHKSTAQRIVDRFLEWVALRHPQGAAGAAGCLALIEGLLVLDASGQADTVDQLFG